MTRETDAKAVAAGVVPDAAIGQKVRMTTGPWSGREGVVMAVGRASENYTTLVRFEDDRYGPGREVSCDACEIATVSGAH